LIKVKKKIPAGIQPFFLLTDFPELEPEAAEVCFPELLERAPSPGEIAAGRS